jgi:branched-chain amino acid transport system substrate-binding protein
MKSLRRYLLLLACSIVTSAAAQERIRFGLAMPLTGAQSAFGKDQVTAASWAVADINAKGGVAGRQLEMIVLDTQAEPQLGINAVTRLAAVDKVQLIFVGWSAVVKAVAPICNREQVLCISAGANSPDLAKLGDYVFTSFPLADVDVSAVARYARQQFGKKTAGVLYINNDTGVEAAKVYRSAFEQAGGKVLAYEAYDPKATDFTGMLLKLRASNPEIVHVQGLVSDLPQIIGQMRQLGLRQPVSTYSVGYNPRLVQQLGAAAEGLIVTSLAPGTQENPRVAPYLARWQTNEKRIPNGLPYTQYLYDQPYLAAALYAAVAKNKLAATGANLRDMLLAQRNFDLPLTGKIEFNNSHRVAKPVYLLRVQKGQFEPLATVP